METRLEYWTVITETSPNALGLVSRTRELADTGNTDCFAVWVAPVLSDEVITNLYIAGARNILHLPVDGRIVSEWNAIAFALAKEAMSRSVSTILFLADTFGRMTAPSVAARCRTGITADCTTIELSRDLQMIQRRPTNGGRFLAEIQTKTFPRIATVRPGIYRKSHYDFVNGKVFQLEYSAPMGLYLVELKALGDREADLTDMDVILAGGIGLGCRENFEKLRCLAAACGAGLGASRAAVAAGYAPYSAQIGQTGTIVRPKLYVAFGISGQIQHLCGMSEAETIIAVNNDAFAPIFDVCDYAIHADCTEVIEQLLKGR